MFDDLPTWAILALTVALIALGSAVAVAICALNGGDDE